MMSTPGDLWKLRKAAINKAHNQDLALARKCGIPSTFVDLHYLKLNSQIEYSYFINRDLPKACLVYSPPGCDIKDYCTLLAKPYISATISHRTLRGNSTGYGEAYCLTILTGLPHNRETISDNEVLEARERISLKLLAKKPKISDLSKSMDILINECKRISSMSSVSGDTAATVIYGWNRSKNCSTQKYHFYLQFGHAVPSTILKCPISQQKWNDLIDLSKGYVNLTDGKWTSSITELTIDQAWKYYNENNITMLYNFIGATMKQESLNILYTSIIVYIAMIGKKLFIEEWIRERYFMFIKSTDNNSRQYIAPIVLTQFSKINPEIINDKELFYSSMISLMKLARRQDMDLIRLILEEAAISNIRFAAVISSLPNKILHFDIEVLLESGIPESDTVNFLRHVLEVLRAPFSTLISNPYKVKEYPNLNYIAIYIEKNFSKKKTYRAYHGEALRYCIIDKTRMESIAKLYTDSLAAIGNSLRYVVNSTQAFQDCLKAGYELLENETYQQKVTYEDNAEKDAAETKRAARKVRINEMISYSRKIQQLSSEPLMLDKTQIANKILAGRSHRSTAFNHLAALLYNASKQGKYGAILKNSINAVSGLCTITRDQEALFKLWDISVPKDYMETIGECKPDDYNQENEDNKYIIDPQPPVMNQGKVKPQDPRGSEVGEFSTKTLFDESQTSYPVHQTSTLHKGVETTTASIPSKTSEDKTRKSQLPIHYPDSK